MPVQINPPAAARRILPALFWLFVALSAIFLAYRPHFGIIDDTRLLDTILAGRPLPFFMMRDIGRFAPLQGQEYNLMAFAGRTPAIFFLWNAAEFVLIAWLLLRIGQLAEAGRRSASPYVLAFGILLTPGFAEAWFRLFIPERDEFVCVAAAVLFYLHYRRRPSASTMAGTLGFAVTALFFKETAFVLVGAWGLFGLLVETSDQSRTRIQRLHGALFGSAISWVAIYYFGVFRYRGPHLYGSQAGSPAVLLARSGVAALVHDPILILGYIAIAVALLRARRLTVLDPAVPIFFLATVSLALAYVALRMSNLYYLLPLYAFVPYVMVSGMQQPAVARVFRHPVAVGMLALMLWNQAALALQQVALWKTSPATFQPTLSFLAETIRSSPARRNVVLADVNRGTGIEYYVSLGDYLLLGAKVSSDRFDLRSDTPVDDPVTYARIMPELQDHGFSFQQPVPTPISSGDLVLLTPGDSMQRRAEFADASRYSPVFATSAHRYPDLSLLGLMRRLRHPNAATGVDPNFAVYQRR